MKPGGGLTKPGGCGTEIISGYFKKPGGRGVEFEITLVYFKKNGGNIHLF